MNWEIIDKWTDRAKTYKGWLVRHWVKGDSGWHMSICFVPDPMHSWAL